jgi:uncharacterized protein YabN with tetrapyrrole methylase and pyrophosphatase domain
VPSGSLTVVGTGIELGTQLTLEARTAITQADIVFCLVAEPAARAWLSTLNPATHSLHTLYRQGRKRDETYDAMTDVILRHVRKGLDVCAAFYGHPGVFVTPSGDLLRQGREEGFRVRLLPGISAEACLFADLGIDPSRTGCQSYEATEFLVHRHRVDPTAALLLWQVGSVGNALATADLAPTGLAVLIEALLDAYPPEHDVTVYEASPYPGYEPLIIRVPLARLSAQHVTGLSTLYVPPREQPTADPTMLERLGLSES